MGILNVTPDSFSDGGDFVHADAAIAHGLRLMDEGATIVDIGGESTRPGAAPLSPAQEQARVLPVLAGLCAEAEKRGVMLSIDTRHAGTMREAIKAGARIINDITALTHDPESLRVAAASQADIVLMHMQGTPQTMQQNPHYADVVAEVHAYLQQHVAVCVEAGIDKNRLIIDPGIGFGKTAAHSALLLRHCDRFLDLGVRLLIGASRKSFLTALTSPAPPQERPKERLGASIAAALMAAEKGAHILRVHDVKETRQALKFAQAMNSI